MNTLGRSRPLVLKFGGSCFLEPDDYVATARYVAGRLAENDRIVVVTSAMSGTTGNLREAQRLLHPEPSADLVAQLLVTGDTVSAVLLATALVRIGVSTRVLEAWETGFAAEGAPDRSYLTGIDPAPLWGSFATSQVVVLAGGQAAGRDRRAVMLGRNSADLSAVAAAVAVGASACEIFSDVPGVLTADPYLIPEAGLIRELSYGTASRMSRSGAKVLHSLAIELAREQDMPIICRGRPPESSRGTVIAGHGSPVVVIADTRSAVWAFPDRSAADARESVLREELDREGLDVVVADYDGVRHLVVPGGDPHGTAARICGSATLRSDLRLLTTVRGEYEPERTLVRGADLISEARRRHQFHYPAPGVAQAAGKTRSDMSGILTGSLTVGAFGGADAPGVGSPAASQTGGTEPA